LKVLVRLAQRLSPLIDDFIHRYVDGVCFIGPIVQGWHVDLRILAVPGNLILVTLIVLILLLFLSLSVKAILF
jgi:hypothetical protein